MQKRKPEIILFFAGFCLILLQFFMIREITAMLLGTEVVIALVTIAYFAGYSIGYGFANKISGSALRSFALIFWAIHLTLPFSLRYLAGYFGRGEGYALSFVAILFFSSVALSSFYSLLLPKFIESESNGDGSGLARLYGMELTGAIFGAASLFLFGGISPVAIPLLYQIGLAVIIALVMGNRLYYFGALAACAIYFFSFTQLQKDSTEYFYKKVRHFRAPEVLYSVNSPYQKVDIVRS
jgi:hypothetical protein